MIFRRILTGGQVMIVQPYIPWPDDYQKYLDDSKGDELINGFCLYSSPKDPGETWGKRGDELFYGYFIGMGNGLEIVITTKGYSSGPWHFLITQGAEWNVVKEFNTLNDLRACLIDESVWRPYILGRLVRLFHDTAQYRKQFKEGAFRNKRRR